MVESDGTVSCAMPTRINDRSGCGCHMLVRYPDQCFILPPRLFAPVAYYRRMFECGHAVVDTSVRYDKRCKAVHRYEIVDVRGRLQLTVPLGKPHGAEGVATWHDAKISTHDQWWRRHRVALESAYGRTPYFEFLIDRFNTVFRSPEEWPEWPSAIDLIREANRAVASVVAPECSIDYIDVGLSSGEMFVGTTCDRRGERFDDAPCRPYWQVRQHIHGFQNGLSILDLLFNLGPESALYLYALNSSEI